MGTQKSKINPWTQAIIASISILSVGCSLTDSSLEEPPAVNFSYELYYTRTSLTGTEYEQYKLLPMGLYVECGLLRRGRAVPSQQGIQTLPLASRSAMATLVAAISEKATVVQDDHFVAAGNNSDMFDPGKFHLTGFADGKPFSIKTSFDGVVNDSGELEQALVRLAETARGVSEAPPCKNLEFFGLKRRGVAQE